VRLRLLACLFLVVSALATTTAQNPSGGGRSARLAIRAGRLLDGRGGPPIVNAVIIVENGVITNEWRRLQE